MSRFTTLLEESLAAAEDRARDIARVVAETAGAGSSTISKQFEAVRSAAEDERRATTDAMSEIYQQGTREAEAMFKASADKFSSMVVSMKAMAAEMQNELESTRTELRRGVFEMPQEAAESTAQMRKVILVQIEALAELNRIVARHGRGMDVVSSATRSAPQREREREPEPVMATVGASRAEARSEAPRTEAPRAEAPRAEAPRRSSSIGTASSLPTADFGTPSRRTEAPSVAPANQGSGDGWLSDLLGRAEDEEEEAPRARAPQQQAAPSNALESLSLDISRLMDRNLAAEMWDRYQRGERKAFSKRLYTPAGQKAFDEVARKYRADRAFKTTVDRYVTEFERLLDEVARDERGPAALRAHLTSETGLVYTLLAHAAGRLG